MLNEKEINKLRDNAKVHKKVFTAIRNLVKDGTTAIEINWTYAEESQRSMVFFVVLNEYTTSLIIYVLV